MKLNFSNIFKYWSPVILWMSFIFWMSTDTFSAKHTSLIIEPILRFLMPEISSQELDMIHGLIRKCGHVVEYFVLGLFLFRAFRASFIRSRIWYWVFPSIIGVVLYAASDEFHQSFVSARTASIIDVGIDTTGGILSQIACVFWCHCSKK
jgi:VanZ family protein